MKIKYTIKQTRNQRPSKQTITNLTKQEAKNWTAWLKSKNATYKLTY